MTYGYYYTILYLGNYAVRFIYVKPLMLGLYNTHPDIIISLYGIIYIVTFIMVQWQWLETYNCLEDQLHAAHTTLRHFTFTHIFERIAF
jgi:hypothetical protein